MARPGSLPGWSLPRTIDGLLWASSMLPPPAARHRVPVPSLARWLLALGIAATMPAVTWPRAGPTVWLGRWSRPGRRLTSVGSYELLVWLIHTWGRPTAGRRPRTTAKMRPAVPQGILSRPQPLMASAPEGASAARQTRRGGPRVSPPCSRPCLPAGSVPMRCWRPALAMRRRWPRTGSACRPETRCRERLFAQAFGRISRRWARARIAAAPQASPLPDPPSTLVPACVGGLGRSAGQA